MKLFNKFICLILFMSVLLSAAPTVSAQESPLLYFTDSTVYIGGSSSYCYLQMRNAENISAMDYMIIYDSDNLELANIYKTGFTSQDDVTVSVNSGEPGIIHITLVSKNGLNGSGYMNLMYFKAKSGAKPGKYPITVLVNDIYNVSLETVTASKNDGVITVKENTQTIKNVRFSDSLSSAAVTVGDEILYKVNAGYLNGLSAGTFDIVYDDVRLKLEEVILSDTLNNAVNNVNSAMSGLVKVAFASEKEISSNTNLMTIKFSAINPGKAEICFKPGELYDYNFTGMTGNSLKKEIVISEPEIVVDNPDLKVIVPETVPSDREFTALIELEGGSGVRAGDFTLCYDKEALSCLEVKSLAAKDFWITADKKIDDGKVRFSLMSNADLAENTTVLSITFKSLKNTDSKSKTTLSGENVYDVGFNKVDLEYVGTEICAVRPEYTVNFYDADGKSLLLSQKVMSGNSAVPPQTGKIRKYDIAEHLKFSGWNKEYSEIFDDTDITAVYSKEAHTSVVKPGYAPGCDTPGRTDEVYCVICGEVLKAAEIIQPVGARIEAKLELGGVLTISGAVSDNVSTAGTTLLAIYDKSEKLLKTIDITELNQADFVVSIQDCDTAEKVKIFRWDLSLVKPLCNAVEINILRYPNIAANLNADGVLKIAGAVSDNEASDNTVLLGVFKENRLLKAVDISAQNQTNIDLENMSEANKVRLFLWESISNMKPIHDDIEVKVTR